MLECTQKNERETITKVCLTWRQATHHQYNSNAPFIIPFVVWSTPTVLSRRVVARFGRSNVLETDHLPFEEGHGTSVSQRLYDCPSELHVSYRRRAAGLC